MEKIAYIEMPAPKKVRDWKGKKVVSLYKVSNGLGSVPAGTVFTITSATTRKELKTNQCECCGLAFKVSVSGTSERFLLEFKFIEEPQS